MAMTAEEIRAGVRNGTLVFCLPAAHENYTTEFLEGFSERILKQDWREFASRGHLNISALLEYPDAEEDLAAAIQCEYGTDFLDVEGLPFWEVVRRCSRRRA